MPVALLSRFSVSGNVMNRSRQIARCVALAAPLLLACCKSEPASREATPEPASSASAKTAKPATPVDLTAMTWTEGGTSMPLVMTPLRKRCLIKHVELVLPRGATIAPLSGNRGCTVRPWGKTGAFFFIVSDALPVKLTPKEKLVGIKRFSDETSESWLAEQSKEPRFFGRLVRKIGKRTIYCLANAIGKDESAARGMMQLCATLKETESK